MVNRIKILPIGIGLIALCMYGCMEMQYTDAALSSGYPGLGSRTFRLKEGTLYAIVGGNPLGTPVVWVHGSPGTWTGWSAFFKDTALLKSFYMIAVARPGFGYAQDFGPVPGLETQATLLNLLLDSLAVQDSVILIGHSMGGPVAARMAMQQPNRFKGLVLAAPALDPDLEEVTWYQRLAAKQYVDQMLPTMIRHSNREMLQLKSELQTMMPYWQEMRCKVIVLQGAKDKLVHPDNARFVPKIHPALPLEVWWDDELGHLIPWDRPELFVQAINTLDR